MLSSAATFSFFLAIGSVRFFGPSASFSCLTIVIVCQVIRTDSLLPPHLQAAQIQLLAPALNIRSKAEGFQLMRARWQAERRREGPVQA